MLLFIYLFIFNELGRDFGQTVMFLEAWLFFGTVHRVGLGGLVKWRGDGGSGMGSSRCQDWECVKWDVNLIYTCSDVFCMVVLLNEILQSTYIP